MISSFLVSLVLAIFIGFLFLFCGLCVFKDEKVKKMAQ